MAGDLRVRLLDRPDITPRLVTAWRDLAGRAAEPNPCNEPDFLLPAMRHLMGGDRARLLVVGRGNELFACLPVVPVRGWRTKAPVPALVAWTHPYQLLGTPLVDGVHAAEAFTALLRAAGSVRGAAMLLNIEDLGTGGPVASALEEASSTVGGRVVLWETYERAVLTRAEADGDGPGTTRHKRVRRSRRSLDRAAGPVTAVDRAGDDGAVDRFLALEAAGWKGKAGTALASDPADSAFFREVCRRFAVAGRLELRSLEIPSGPVAMQVALRAGDGVFHFKVAYDETYRDYSPGVQLLVDFVDSFPDESVAFRDSCTAADNVTESHLWAARRGVADVVVPFAPALSRAVVAALGRLHAWRSSPA